jgi:hypothetical protein
MGKKAIYAGFRWENFKERTTWKIILNLIYKWGDGAWTGLIWLRMGTGGGLL